MAERDFVQKLERVGLVDVQIVERRPWSIDDCSRYPLFDDTLIGLMRDLVEPEAHDSVAAAMTFTARKP